MMNNDGAFASPRSSANTAAIAISLQDLLSQATKIFVVLPVVLLIIWLILVRIIWHTIVPSVPSLIPRSV